MVETEGVPVDDETAETEMEFHLPRGSDPGPDRMPKKIPVITPDPGQQHRLGPLSGAKPFQSSFKAPTLLALGLGSPPPKAGTQPVIDRSVETPFTPTPGHGSLPPKPGAQPVTNRSVETPFTPTPELGSLPPKARTQSATDRRSMETPPTPSPGHGSPPPKAGTAPVTDQSVEKPTKATTGHGSLPPKAGTQPVTDRFVETSPMQPRGIGPDYSWLPSSSWKSRPSQPRDMADRCR